MKTFIQQNVSGTWWSNVTEIDCAVPYAVNLVDKLNEAEQARGSKARYRISVDGREYNPLAVKSVSAGAKQWTF